MHLSANMPEFVRLAQTQVSLSNRIHPQMASTSTSRAGLSPTSPPFGRASSSGGSAIGPVRLRRPLNHFHSDDAISAAGCKTVNATTVNFKRDQYVSNTLIHSILTKTGYGLGLRLQMLAHIHVAATHHTISRRKATTSRPNTSSIGAIPHMVCKDAPKRLTESTTARPDHCPRS